MIIGQNPAKYGFQENDIEKYPDLEAVEVPSPIDLRQVATLAGIPYADLRRWNAHLREGITPPNLTSYEIWVPEAKAEALKSMTTKLVAYRINRLRPSRQLVSEDAPRHYYLVENGDTLASIAHENKVSISYLRRLNNLRTSRIYSGQRLRVTAKVFHGKRFARYRVRPGDSIAGIARRFGISVHRLKKMNALRTGSIYSGQILRVSLQDT